jgi:hypothetical protein
VFAAWSTFLQTDRSVEARLKEHQWHIRLEQPGKTTVATYCVDLGYHIQFHNTTAHSVDFLPTPRLAPITTLACYLLAHFYDVFPSLSLMVFHKAHCPSPSVFIELFLLTGTQSAATCSSWFLDRGFFYPEDGDDAFLRDVGSYKIYMASHPRKRHSS